MLVGMMVPAVAAALGGLIIAFVSRLLPFGAPPEVPWFWRVMVVVASAAGLAAGGLHARRQHAAPPLGWLPGALERALAAATEFPSLTIFAAARGVDRIERWLDTAARRIAAAAWAIAIGSDRVERRDFGAGGDRLAQAFQSGGAALRPLESGKLYLYTLGLFVWSLGVLIAGGLAFIW
jgi:hypothetical protein